MHLAGPFENNGAEVLHQPTQEWKRRRDRFEAAAHAQLFPDVPEAAKNLFRVGRHHLMACHHCRASRSSTCRSETGYLRLLTPSLAWEHSDPHRVEFTEPEELSPLGNVT